MAEESGEQIESRRERVKSMALNPVYVFLLISGVLVLLLVVIFPDFFPVWFGIGELRDGSANEVIRSRKTVWDWLELLIVPAILAAGAWWFANAQQNRELGALEESRKIEKDKQEQEALKNYFDRISKLFDDDQPSASDRSAPRNSWYQDDDTGNRNGQHKNREIEARARTLNILRNVNETRKGQVIRFLSESRLIDGEEPKIILFGADLQDIDLRGAYMINNNLTGVDLRGADLSEAVLIGARLVFADLRAANFSKAIFTLDDLDNSESREDEIRKRFIEASGKRDRNNDVGPIDFDNAIYNSKTNWPRNFSPENRWLDFVDDDDSTEV